MHHIISFLLRVAYAAGFGFILLFHTEDIINYIPQLLGGLIMLESIAQMMELFLLKVKTHVNWWFFLVPSLILVYSLFLIFCCNSEITDNTTVREAFAPSHGFSWTTMELQIGGICFIAFLVHEFIISLKFMKPLYMPAKFAEEEAIRKEAEKLKAQEELKAQAANKAAVCTPSSTDNPTNKAEA